VSGGDKQDALLILADLQSKIMRDADLIEKLQDSNEAVSLRVEQLERLIAKGEKAESSCLLSNGSGASVVRH